MRVVSLPSLIAEGDAIKYNLFSSVGDSWGEMLRCWDKMLHCNIQAAESKCGLNASITSHMYLSDWRRRFHLFLLWQEGAWVSEERSGKQEVLKWLLSPVPRFFISREFRLWNPDSRCERTKEDPWNAWNLRNTGGCWSPEEKTSLSSTHFAAIRKTFTRPTTRLCVETHVGYELGMRSLLHWCMKMLFSINFWSMPEWIQTTLSSLTYQADMNSECVFWPGMFPPACASYSTCSS